MKKTTKKEKAVKKEPAAKPKPAAKRKPPKAKAAKKPAPAARQRRSEEKGPDWYSCAFCHTYEEKPFAVCKACGHPQPAGK
jgi:hypothetical protein